MFCAFIRIRLEIEIVLQFVSIMALGRFTLLVN